MLFDLLFTKDRRKKKLGIIIKLINVKLNGAKPKTPRAPIINGRAKTIKNLLFDIFSNIN